MSSGRASVRRVLLLCACVALGPAGVGAAEEHEAKPDEKPAEAAAPAPKEESSVTDHSMTIGGQSIPYKATASTTLLKNDKDEPTALLYSTAYVRSDVKDRSQRPVAFLYNGGPGSSSIWLHMGSFAPKRVVTANAASTPPAPYRLVDNAWSLLDRADLVFIDPVGTGFSRAVGKAQDKDFWGVDQDVRSLAQFISTWVSRNNRWNSPKFLIGESYGTFRSAALANYLQSREGLYFNGLVLVSSVLDLGTISFLPGTDMSYVFYLPSYAATAWYHKMLKDRPEDLNAFVADARRYAEGEYATALMKGARLTAAEKTTVARSLARFTGLGEDYLVKADLRVALPQFMQELQRARGLTTGRLDSRFSGFTYDLLGEFANYDPQDVAITGAYTAVFNTYVREELKFGRDRVYRTGSNDAGNSWDWKREGAGGFGFPGTPNTEGDLINAMITNPHLKVEVENGIYDLATPFFATEYTMEHLGLPETLQKNIQQQYYEAGHMMYVRDEDLAKLKANVARFIESASSR
ncbi:MAG TPA: peptidase S10 [Candidatus Polarisedimenticolia bacterium]|nr:peptidase S10 [Candidatus Polarisedimenticolia bacterium]